MKPSPWSPALAKGLAKSAASATRTNGETGTPSTRSRTSLIHTRRGPSEPMVPTIGRVVHLPCMPNRASLGIGMSPGLGTSQFGGDQILPCGFSVRRNNWHEARAIGIPPERKSASITRMRKPSRIDFVFTSTGVLMFGKRNMSTVRRAGTKSVPPWRSSIAWASSPTTTRPCIEFGSHGPLATSVGIKASRSRVKKGRFVMVRDHDEFFAVKSRVRGCFQPFRAHAYILLGGHRLRGQRVKTLASDQLRQRPHRCTTDQRARIGQKTFGLAGQRGIAGIADRDQHIADKAVTAGALNRRFCKTRAKAGIVETREPGKVRRA